MTVELYLGDCLDILPTLETGSVDAVITDPPYGVGFSYASHKDDLKDYPAFLSELIRQADRLVRPHCPIMIWQAAKHVRLFSEWFGDRNWRLLIGAKNFAQVLPGPTWPAFEPIVTWWKDGSGEAYGECRRDFFLADTTPSGRKRRGEIVQGHPCPRPIEHLLWVISTWVKPSGTVLDMTMGSGTTGVACVQTGRNFIGIEIDPTYFEIAKQRIEAAQGEYVQLEAAI